jgi:hypothetical protein
MSIMGTHHRTVIVGGGSAGISVAARLRRKGQDDVAVIDPAATRYYQPLWTLVGGGRAPVESSARSEASVMPKGVTWIRQAAVGVDPEAKEVVLSDGTVVSYYYLVICPGIQLDWDTVECPWRQRGDGTRGDGLAVPFGILGGRLYHVITDPELYFGPGKSPIHALYIWDGGLGIWGAVALGAVGAAIGCRRAGIWPRDWCSPKRSAAGATTSTRSCSAGSCTSPSGTSGWRFCSCGRAAASP